MIARKKLVFGYVSRRLPLPPRPFQLVLLPRHDIPLLLPPPPRNFRCYTTLEKESYKMSESEAHRSGMGEQEPLLGRAGDASQQDGLPLYHNLIIGMTSSASIAHRITTHTESRHRSYCTSWILDPRRHRLGRSLFQPCYTLLGASCKASRFQDLGYANKTVL